MGAVGWRALAWVISAAFLAPAIRCRIKGGHTMARQPMRNIGRGGLRGQVFRNRRMVLLGFALVSLAASSATCVAVITWSGIDASFDRTASCLKGDRSLSDSQNGTFTTQELANTTGEIRLPSGSRSTRVNLTREKHAARSRSVVRSHGALLGSIGPELSIALTLDGCRRVSAVRSGSRVLKLNGRLT